MFVVPDVPSQFSHHEYWDRFYESLSSTQNFEWYMEWDELRKVALDMFLRGSKEKQLLELGCGNSNLSMKMSEAYPNLKITAIDIADEAVERTKQSCSAIKCLKMDATKMQFGDAEFDIVFDKGTLDTLYCDRQLGDKMLDEVYRVLRPCGLYISISLAQKNVLSSWIERMSSLRCILKVMALPSSKHLTYPAFAFIAMKPFNATSAIPQTLSWSDKRDNQPPKKFTVAEIMKLVANLQ